MKNVQIGDEFYEPETLNVFLDTGSSAFFIYQTDAEGLVEYICDYVDKNLKNSLPGQPQCI